MSQDEITAMVFEDIRACALAKLDKNRELVLSQMRGRQPYGGMDDNAVFEVLQNNASQDPYSFILYLTKLQLLTSNPKTQYFGEIPASARQTG